MRFVNGSPPAIRRLELEEKENEITPAVDTRRFAESL